MASMKRNIYFLILIGIAFLGVLVVITENQKVTSIQKTLSYPTLVQRWIPTNSDQNETETIQTSVPEWIKQGPISVVKKYSPSERAFRQKFFKNTKLVTYANVALWNYLEHFTTQAQKAGFNKIYLIPLDTVICDKIADFKMNDTIECLENHHKTTFRYVRWNPKGKDYQNMLFSKVLGVLRMLENGSDVLLLDVDAFIVNEDFWKWFQDKDTDIFFGSDMVYEEDGKPNTSTTDWICAGLFYAKSNNNTIDLMLQTYFLMKSARITDQDAMQIILTGKTQLEFFWDKEIYHHAKEIFLRDGKEIQLVWTILPDKYFPNGVAIKMGLSDVKQWRIVHFNRGLKDKNESNKDPEKLPFFKQMFLSHFPTCSVVANTYSLFFDHSGESIDSSDVVFRSHLKPFNKDSSLLHKQLGKKNNFYVAPIEECQSISMSFQEKPLGDANNVTILCFATNPDRKYAPFSKLQQASENGIEWIFLKYDITKDFYVWLQKELHMKITTEKIQLYLVNNWITSYFAAFLASRHCKQVNLFGFSSYIPFQLEKEQLNQAGFTFEELIGNLEISQFLRFTSSFLKKSREENGLVVHKGPGTKCFDQCYNGEDFAFDSSSCFVHSQDEMDDMKKRIKMDLNNNNLFKSLSGTKKLPLYNTCSFVGDDPTLLIDQKKLGADIDGKEAVWRYHGEYIFESLTERSHKILKDHMGGVTSFWFVDPEFESFLIHHNDYKQTLPPEIQFVLLPWVENKESQILEKKYKNRLWIVDPNSIMTSKSTLLSISILKYVCKDVHIYGVPLGGNWVDPETNTIDGIKEAFWLHSLQQLGLVNVTWTETSRCHLNCILSSKCGDHNNKY